MLHVFRAAIALPKSDGRESVPGGPSDAMLRLAQWNNGGSEAHARAWERRNAPRDVKYEERFFSFNSMHTYPNNQSEHVLSKYKFLIRENIKRGKNHILQL